MASSTVLLTSRVLPSRSSVPSFIAPMLLDAVQSVPAGEPWLYELKWDGFRCIATKHGNNVRLFSRNGNDFTDKFPEIADAILGLDTFAATLDGEIVALDSQGRPCFQRLQNGDRSDCHYFLYAFDLLHLGSKSLLKLPLEERKGQLGELVSRSGVRFSASLNGSAEQLTALVTEQKLEGVVAKRRTSIYEPGKRSGAWVKWKALRVGEFFIGGFRPCDRTFDCVTVGVVRDGALHFVGKVQAGFNPRSRHSMLALFRSMLGKACPFTNLPHRTRGRWRDGITAEDMPAYRWLREPLPVHLAYQEWTDAGLLRHPRIMAPRS